MMQFLASCSGLIEDSFCGRPNSVQNAVVANLIRTQGAVILKPLAAEDNEHVVGRDVFFVLDLGLESFDGVVKHHVQETDIALKFADVLDLHEQAVDVRVGVIIGRQAICVDDGLGTQFPLAILARCYSS